MEATGLIAIWTFSILLLFGLVLLSKSLLKWKEDLGEVQQNLSSYKDSLVKEDKKLTEHYKELAEKIKEFGNVKHINDEIVKSQLQNVYHGLLDLKASSEALLKQLDPYSDKRAIENIQDNIKKIETSIRILDEQPGFTYKPFNKLYFNEKYEFSKN